MTFVQRDRNVGLSQDKQNVSGLVYNKGTITEWVEEIPQRRRKESRKLKMYGG